VTPPVWGEEARLLLQAPNKKSKARLRCFADVAMGTTYAIWTGIGAVGTLALGILRLIT
jgi:hypothetical protein